MSIRVCVCVLPKKTVSQKFSCLLSLLCMNPNALTSVEEEKTDEALWISTKLLCENVYF